MKTTKPFHVVAALDLDATARPTWAAATALLGMPGAELSLLHVVGAGGRDVRRDAADAAALMSEGHRGVQELLARELGDASNPLRERIDVYVGLGDPAQQIIQLAVDLEADLIVLGTHERRGLERLVLGSVSSEVFRHAPCSVLVSRAPDYVGKEKTPSIAPPLAEGESPMIRATGGFVRYRSLPFSTYNASLFPTGIPRKQVR
jgi:nucleotide-binding universal stress UspA family protein